MATSLFQSFKVKHLVSAIVAIAASSVAIQASAAHSYPSKLVGGESLAPGEFITSPNGAVKLIMQMDGNLVLYRVADMVPLWSSNSWGNPGASAPMQMDGNFVVYGPTGTVLFNTGTGNRPGARLDIQSDNNLVLYTQTNGVLWSTYTGIAYYSTPAYEPAYWNTNTTVRTRNNCYNYSNNKRTDTFAQPGLGGSVVNHTMSVAAVTSAALADGLVKTTATEVSPNGKTRIALVVAPGQDYHWYRQDIDGRWTHKPGQTNATDKDNSGVTISNPETANRGAYTAFGGYFFTPSSSVQGQGTANIK